MKNNDKLELNKQARLEVLERIRQNEKLGGEAFFNDVEIDPPHSMLMPNDVDYQKKKFSSKVKTFFANILASIWAKKVVKDFNVEVVGVENFNGVDSGAMITSNHFSIYENAAVWEAIKKSGKRKKFYRIIREGNYFFPGFIGFLLRHARTLPISENVKTMMNLSRAVEKFLANGDYVLIYPEKAMWWNYRKPRPFKVGAFHYAAKSGVPVVPCFTTMEDTDKLDENGFPMQKYTVHVMPPIYPDKDKSIKENGIIMMEKNHKLVVDKYEEVYGKKLTFDND
ncbi:MAG: 1-acyl-sn-glycerol-3-phosphate acyltransferase [Clostridia bacterium]|nr:1-acyl-sn-glycerol-3-phosphate acyltransferase [Clostridia bacterium]